MPSTPTLNEGMGLKPGDEFEVDGRWLIVLSAEDYARLLEACEADDMILWCEVCGAWIDRNDAAAASTEDFEGCWKAATGRARDGDLCRSYRVSEAVRCLRDRPPSHPSEPGKK